MFSFFIGFGLLAFMILGGSNIWMYQLLIIPIKVNTMVWMCLSIFLFECSICFSFGKLVEFSIQQVNDNPTLSDYMILQLISCIATLCEY